MIPRLDELRIGYAELRSAQLTPPCVVENYLYRDVAILPGPGGTGKTTLALWEAAHIVLGRPLYGLQVVTPGPVVIVTAEDRKDLLLARLREIMEAIAEQTITEARDGNKVFTKKMADEWVEEAFGPKGVTTTTVWDQVMIWDVTGDTCRLTELDKNNNVVLTGMAR